MGVLEDSLDDTFIFNDAFLGESDVNVKVGEGSVEFVVMGGGELESQALGY